MSKTFVVQLRKTGLLGPVSVTSNIITITGATAGTMLSNDFKDNTLGEPFVTDIDRTATIVKPTGRPVIAVTNSNFSLTANTASVNENQPVRITLDTTGVEPGTQVPFTVTGVSSTDIYSEYITGTTGYFIVPESGSTYRDIMILADGLAEGTETMTVSLDGYYPIVSTSVTINDTSLSTSGNAVLSIGGYSGVLTGSATLPKAATWLMFRITGAGGSGGSSNIELSGANGGRGGAGVTVRGIVQLPRTENNKILIGGVGSGGERTVGINSSRISPGIGFSFSDTDYICFGGVGGGRSTDRSGAGGNGGGSTSLGFAISGASPFRIIPIAAAGGGGGGGGASGYGSGGDAKLGNISIFSVETLPSLNGQNATKSELPLGGGGGGGGAGVGAAGFASNSMVLTSTGGTTGINLKNTNSILKTADWNYFDIITANAQVDISTVANVAANTQAYFGSGSLGGTYLNNGNAGAQGAIAIYWTTGDVAPTDWNLIPEYLEPNIIAISARGIGSTTGTDAYLRFNQDGTISSSDSNGPLAWTSIPHTNIGNIYQIRATRLSGNANLLSPINGLGSNLGQWLTLSSAREWYLKTSAATTEANLRIEIRGASSQTVFANVVYRLASKTSGDTSLGAGFSGGSMFTASDFTSPGLLLYKAFDQVMGGNARDLFVDIIEGDDYSNRIPLEGQAGDWDVEQIGNWVDLNCIVYDDDQIDPNSTFVQLCRFVDNFKLAQDAIATWADVVDQANQDLGLWNSLDQSTQDYYDPILNAIAQREAELGELGINTSLFGTGKEGWVLTTGDQTVTAVVTQPGDTEKLDNSSLYGFVGQDYQVPDSLSNDENVQVGQIRLTEVTSRDTPDELEETPLERANRLREEQDQSLLDVRVDVLSPKSSLTPVVDGQLTPVINDPYRQGPRPNDIIVEQPDGTRINVSQTQREGGTAFIVYDQAPKSVNDADPGVTELLSRQDQRGYLQTPNEQLDAVRVELENRYVEALESRSIRIGPDGDVSGEFYSELARQTIDQHEKVDLLDQYLIWYDDGTLNIAATFQWLAANDQDNAVQAWGQIQLDAYNQAVAIWNDDTKFKSLELDGKRTVLELVKAGPVMESMLYYIEESAGIRIFPEGQRPDPSKILSIDDLQKRSDELALQQLNMVDRFANRELGSQYQSIFGDATGAYWDTVGIEEEILSKNLGYQVSISEQINSPQPTVYQIQLDAQVTAQGSIPVSNLDQNTFFDELYAPASLDLAGSELQQFNPYGDPSPRSIGSAGFTAERDAFNLGETYSRELYTGMNEKGEGIRDIIGVQAGSNDFDFGIQGGANTIGTSAYYYEQQIQSGSTYVGTGAAAVPMDPYAAFWRSGGISYKEPSTTGGTGSGLFAGEVSGEFGGVNSGSVFILAHMPGTDKLAGDMQPGDPLTLLNSDRTGTVLGTVIRNRVSRQKLITLVSESGIELTLSDNTPITLEDGSYINSLDAFGHKLPVLDDAGFRWEMIIDVRDLGPGLVATIYCDDQCYAAGDQPGRYIITHNIDYVKAG